MTRAGVENTHLSPVEQVMLHYQEAMRRMTSSFFQAQEVVMLAYLRSSIRGSCQVALPAVSSLVLDSVSPIVSGSSDEVRTSHDFGERFANGKLEQPEGGTGHSAETCNPVTVSMDECVSVFTTEESLLSSFIELVSERTGYPIEMLDPSIDLESDLGIDSIKRVEILANFRRMLPESMSMAFEGRAEELANLRTLQSVSDWMRRFQSDTRDI